MERKKEEILLRERQEWREGEREKKSREERKILRLYRVSML